MKLILGNTKLNIKYEELGTIHSLKPGEVLMDSGNAGKFLVFLIEGYAKMYFVNKEGKESLVYLMQPPTIFGEVSTFTGFKFHNTVVVSLTPVKVIMMETEDIENKIKRNPEIALLLIKTASHKIASLTSRLQGESFHDSLTIISDVLLAFSSINKEIRLSHDEIAEAVGRNRVTVSKALSKLKNIGAIEQGKRRIIIKNPDLLKQISYDRDFEFD